MDVTYFWETNWTLVALILWNRWSTCFIDFALSMISELRLMFLIEKTCTLYFFSGWDYFTAGVSRWNDQVAWNLKLLLDAFFFLKKKEATSGDPSDSGNRKTMGNQRCRRWRHGATLVTNFWVHCLCHWKLTAFVLERLNLKLVAHCTDTDQLGLCSSLCQQ